MKHRSLKPKVFSKGKTADALAASMAVPLLFKPIWSNGRPLLDGAVGDVAGVAGLERSERVLYHHVSFPAADTAAISEVNIGICSSKVTHPRCGRYRNKQFIPYYHRGPVWTFKDPSCRIGRPLLVSSNEIFQ